QFTQVMLLPQGEFARFLRSGDDDRRKLLTRLFGTSLYDRITAELGERRTEATRTRELAGRAIADAVSAAARAEAAEATAAALRHDVDDEQGLGEREAELDRLEQAAKAAEERVAALERARQDLPDRITTLETRLAEASTTAAGLGAAAQHLDA